MASSLVGAYLAPAHNLYLDYLRRLNPGMVRILDPGLSDIVQVHKAVPNALILPRDWALSEQKDDIFREPIATGQRHAMEWLQKIQGWREQANQANEPFPPDFQFVVVGGNELPIWESPLWAEAAVEYSISFAHSLQELDLFGVVFELNTGHPAGVKPATKVGVSISDYAFEGKLPDWSALPHLDKLEQAINEGKHYLGLHEYWYHSGPQDGWGWHAGRHWFCPLQVPFIIGEAGVDNYVDTERWKAEGGNRGWRDHITPEQYAEQLAWYTERVDQRRVAGILPFLTDFRAHEWWSFDTAPAHDAILAQASRFQRKEPLKPNRVHVPIVQVGTPPKLPPEVSPGLKVGKEYRSWFEKYGSEYGIPWSVLAALAYCESAYNPTAVSSAGAQGLMQFMPGTWADVQRVLGGGDPFNPHDSIRASAYYLNQIRAYLKNFGRADWPWILAGYNHGPGNAAVKEWADIPPETRQYAHDILTLAEAFRRWETEWWTA